MRYTTNALMRACAIDELPYTEGFNMPKDPCYIVSVLLSPGVIFPLHYSRLLKMLFTLQVLHPMHHPVKWGHVQASMMEAESSL